MMGAAWKPPGLPVAIALACGAAGFFAQVNDRPRWHVEPCVTCAKPPPPPDPRALIAARTAMNGGKLSANRWIIVADAMMRHGQTADAVGVLRGTLEADPNNAEAWLAMGDALFAHAGGGHLNDAASYAYHRADQAEIRAGKAPLLVSEQFLRSGRRALAGQWLERQLRDAPAGAPWRGELERRLAVVKSSRSGQPGAMPAHTIAPPIPCC